MSGAYHHLHTAARHIREAVNERPWTERPAAAALLADCAARQPASTRHRDFYAITVDEWTEYSRRDPRVKLLDAIRDEAFEIAETQTSEAVAAVIELTVDRAIAEIAARHEGGRGRRVG